MAMLALVAVAFMQAGGALAAAQPPPDITGQWRLIGAAGHDPQNPPTEVLTVRAPDPGPQGPRYQTLVIQRSAGARVSTSTLRLGIIGGMAGGVVNQGESRSGWMAKWMDGHLLVWQEEQRLSDGRESSTETTEDWSINAAGHLVITTGIRRTGEAPRRFVEVYRRR